MCLFLFFKDTSSIELTYLTFLKTISDTLTLEARALMYEFGSDKIQSITES